MQASEVAVVQMHNLADDLPVGNRADVVARSGRRSSFEAPVEGCQRAIDFEIVEYDPPTTESCRNCAEVRLDRGASRVYLTGTMKDCVLRIVVSHGRRVTVLHSFEVVHRHLPGRPRHVVHPRMIAGWSPATGTLRSS